MLSGEAILVISAAVLNFCLGGIWYALLGKKWIKASNLNRENLNKKDPVPYLIAFIGSLWASYGMFLMIKHIRPKNLEELLTIALGTWLFILVGMVSKHYAFAGRSLSAFMIDNLLDLFGLILICLIIWN
jgi:hypothetical protein